MEQKDKIQKMHEFARLLLEENNVPRIIINISAQVDGACYSRLLDSPFVGQVNVPEIYSYEVGCFVIAHEVRHAIQHRRKTWHYRLLNRLRTMKSLVFWFNLMYLLATILSILLREEYIMWLSLAVLLSVPSIAKIFGEIDANIWAWQQVENHGICRSNKTKIDVARTMIEAQLSYIYPILIICGIVLSMYHILPPLFKL